MKSKYVFSSIRIESEMRESVEEWRAGTESGRRIAETSDEGK